MFFIVGYNFCSDGNCLDATPSVINNINDVTIKNGIFDHLNITGDTTSSYSSGIPTTWELLTMMDANFNGNINAGNVGFALSELSGFRIKRRKITDFNWVTLDFIPIENASQLQFISNDNLAQSGAEYEYAFVPVINGIEGNYMTNTISTNFKGVFICDQDTIYRFYAGVSYGTTEQVQKIGVMETLGSKYPVFVSGAMINYQKGHVDGTVLQNTYTETRQIDRLAIAKERDELVKFLTNKGPKIIKDWNGNSYLVMVTGNPQTTYLNNSGMGIANVGFDWTEAGDSNSESDLIDTGMIAGDT